MTEKLFYKDVEQKIFEANIEGVKKETLWKVCLDRTAFYPEGGGQPCDRGVIKLEDGTALFVVDVQEIDDEIWHTVESAAGVDLEEKLLPGKAVSAEIDWVRRFDHMQQHSGEHIVSGMICARFRCDNIGFHMSEDVIVIDYNARITMEEALEIEDAANTYLWENHPFVVQWPTAEELKTLDYRSKKELEGPVRITSFPGADCCACCGTHVASSAQVGLVKFLSAKDFHEGTRLELLCGKRAMDYLAMNHRVNKAAAVLLSTSEENTEDRVRKLMDENIGLKTKLSALEDTYFALLAKQYEGQKNVLIVSDVLEPVQARTLADMIADQCAGTVAVFAKTENGYSYALIDRTEDIATLVKEMNGALDGRGGGRNGFAQGSVKAGREQIELFFNPFFVQ